MIPNDQNNKAKSQSEVIEVKSDLNLKSMDAELKFILSVDSDSHHLEGNRNYRLRLPLDMPEANFWSVVVYDSQTNLLIKSDQAWPSVHSNCRKLFRHPDGSVEIRFGPKAPESMENNWIQTVPGKDWYMVLRLYHLLEPLTNKAWSPGEIESLN